jgi:hypothetical protein
MELCAAHHCVRGARQKVARTAETPPVPLRTVLGDLLPDFAKNAPDWQFGKTSCAMPSAFSGKLQQQLVGPDAREGTA